MKKIVIMVCVVLASLVTYAQDNLQFPIEPTMAKEWKYLSDQVMGGVSEGGTTLLQDGDRFYLRLTGDVSTRNNGGFVQFRSKVSLFNKPEMFQLIHKADKDGDGLEGVRLNVRGNGETYHVMIRTYFTWSPSDYYYHTFETSPNWKKVDLPFKKFKSSKYRERGLEVIKSETLLSLPMAEIFSLMFQSLKLVFINHKLGKKLLTKLKGNY